MNIKEFLQIIVAFTIIILYGVLMIILICRLPKSRVYVDRTWRGWQLESYKFKTDTKNTVFVIFTGLRNELNYADFLDLEAEMEDVGILPMFISSNHKADSIIFLLDRNNGNRYRYMGKYSKIKFERILDE